MTADRLVEAFAQRLGEVAHQVDREIGVLGQVRCEQRLVKRHLGVREQHRKFGRGEAMAGLLPLGDGLVVGQVLDFAVEFAGALESAHQSRLRTQHADALRQSNAERLGLLVVVAQHQIADLVGHLRQQVVALFVGHVAIGDHGAEQDLDVDLVVRTIDAGRVVDRVGKETAAGQGVFDAAALGQSQVAALADNAAAQLLAVDADRVVGAVADLGVAFLGRLDVGADAAVPQQIDRRQHHGMDQFVGRQLVGLDAERLLGLGRDVDRLRLAIVYTAALRNQLGVVVLPTRARQVEHALAFLEALGRVRVGVEEDMQVVERAEQADVFGQQHAVAEHVARHVADADAGEVGGLAVDAHLAEMALDRFPGAARGDAHALVVVALRAAAREGVAQPMAVVDGDAVGDVRERRRALVGGDHEIGVVAVVPHDPVGRHDGAGDEIVGQVEHAGDHHLVARNAFRQLRLAAARERRSFDDEAALRADRHDDRVLDLLGLHEAEDLGTEILAPVRPAQSAARHRATAQMHRLDARREQEYLDQGARQRQFVDCLRVELERERGLGPAIGAGLEKIGPERRLNEVEEPS